MSNVSLLLNKCIGLNKCINEQWEVFKPYFNKSSAGAAYDVARWGYGSSPSQKAMCLSLVCPSSLSFRNAELTVVGTQVAITIASLKPHFDKVNNTFNDPLRVLSDPSSGNLPVLQKCAGRAEVSTFAKHTLR